MQKSYESRAATHTGPESCGAIRKNCVEALKGERARQKRAHGDVIVVRIADDIVVGFRDKVDAEQFRAELTERMRKSNLELHPEKTRLLEFGPYAIDQRQWRGEGEPGTFNFLGFTHICMKKTSNGQFGVQRQTIRKRLQTKLNEVKAGLQRRMHEPIPEVGK